MTKRQIKRKEKNKRIVIEFDKLLNNWLDKKPDQKPINFSKYALTEDETELLSLGPSYILPPEYPDSTSSTPIRLSNIDSTHQKHPDAKYASFLTWELEYEEIKKIIE